MHDCHNHLHFAELDAVRKAVLEWYRLNNAGCIVNGTTPQDWPVVAALAASNPDVVVPSFGIHPWRVGDPLPDGWEPQLREYLNRFPGSGVGEVGLDKWIIGADVRKQEIVLRKQLDLAIELNRPVTIHCLKAFGRLLEVLHDYKANCHKFLLHAFAAPDDLFAEFVALGCYFSFNLCFLKTTKVVVREQYRSLPLAQLLIETDAPSMKPLPYVDRFAGAEFNDPRNLETVIKQLAILRGLTEAELSGIICQNIDAWWATS